MDVQNILPKLSYIKEIIIIDKTTSTNDEIFSNFSNKKVPFVVIADNQTNGRGRFQRSWISKKGQLAMSLGLKSPYLPTRTEFLPIASAVAVALALRNLKAPAFIKWPNDIVIKENYKESTSYCGEFKKVGGILIENHILGQEILSAIGIGINIESDPDLSVIPHATFLKSYVAEINRDKLAEALLVKLDSIFMTTWSELLRDFKKLCVTIGQEVIAGDLHGQVLDISDEGYLIIDNGFNAHVVSSGEVWLGDKKLS